MELITPPNIMFVLGLIGVGYAVFKTIYDPQKKSETNDLLMDQRANFLKEEYDKKFNDIQTSFNSLITLNQNHIHTVETKVDGLNNQIVFMAKDIVKLETIINERIPKKI